MFDPSKCKVFIGGVEFEPMTVEDVTIGSGLPAVAYDPCVRCGASLGNTYWQFYDGQRAIVPLCVGCYDGMCKSKGEPGSGET